MRRSIFVSPALAFVAWLPVGLAAGLVIAIPPAKAQEPLLLRIRPAGDPAAGLGSAGGSDDGIARDARARSQAVWDRADRRAHIAIASVCTGCIAPARTPAISPVRTGEAAPAAASVPPFHFAQTGAP